jgi:hypothetical protein
MAILKHIRTSLTAILLLAAITITVTTSIQPVFAPRDCPGCIGDFQKLTGELVQNVINRQQLPNSDDVVQFRILTAQFERDVIDAVLDGDLSLIPRIASQYTSSLSFIRVLAHDQDEGTTYIQEVLRIFCKPCV